MRIRQVLRPGQRGTKRLLAKYGDRLICVRYRYDEQRLKRYKTVELIVSEADWTPAALANATVDVRIAWYEDDLKHAVKSAGGRWSPQRKLWSLPYAKVVTLNLVDRIVDRRA